MMIVIINIRNIRELINCDNYFNFDTREFIFKGRGNYLKKINV